MNINLKVMLAALVVAFMTVFAGPSIARASDQLETRTYESVRQLRKETTIDEHLMFAANGRTSATRYPIHGAFGAYTGHIRHHGDRAWFGTRDVLAIEEQVARESGIDLKTAGTLALSVRHAIAYRVARRAGVQLDIPASELTASPAQATGAPAPTACSDGVCNLPVQPPINKTGMEVPAVVSYIALGLGTGTAAILFWMAFLSPVFNLLFSRKRGLAVSRDSGMNSRETITQGQATFEDGASEALSAAQQSTVPPKPSHEEAPSAAAPGAIAPDPALNPDDTDAPFLNLPDRSAPKPKPRARKTKATAGTGALPSLIEAAKAPRTPKGEGRGLDALMRDKPDPKPA